MSLAKNLEMLQANHYPGRGIIQGIDETGRIIQVYWIMGRSSGSRNRVFEIDDSRGVVWTEPADPSLETGNSKLTIYNAMRESNHAFVVSNGFQTDTILEALSGDRSFDQATSRLMYEPDNPIYTPRISAACLFRGAAGVHYAMCLHRKRPGKEMQCDRFVFNYGNITPGTGYCLTTYAGDGNPPAAFRGEPYELPLIEDPSAILGLYWSFLDKENLVSLAVKVIDPHTLKSGILVRNKYKKHDHD